jgi:hypothetical protein
VAISEQKALQRLRGEPGLPVVPLPEFLELPARRDWPIQAGRVILPDLPLTEAEGRDAGLRWAAEVLTAIADVLDADPSATSYVLRLLRLAAPSARLGGVTLHRDGYNLLVPGPLDWDVARARLDPDLPPDWDRDDGNGPAKAIGMMARYETLRGPSEIETVGFGLAGRRRLRRRRDDFERWQADQSPAGRDGS